MRILKIMELDYIDIGVNFLEKSFANDLDEVLKRAFESNVNIMINTSSSIEETNKSLELIKKFPNNLYTTAGIHPHNAQSGDEYLEQNLLKLIENNGVVAIGECGLDYFRNFSPKEKQLSVFETHLEVANKSGLPLLLHQRDSHQDFVKCLKEIMKPPILGVAHCFTGTLDQMKTYIDMGLYIGITGWICDERRNHDLLKAVKELPLDRLLIETDSPYLSPRTLKRVRRNEPKNLPHIAKKLALEMGVELSMLRHHSVENAKNLFNISN